MDDSRQEESKSTSPAGGTGGLRVSLIKAVMESARRSGELLPPD